MISGQTSRTAAAVSCPGAATVTGSARLLRRVRQIAAGSGRRACGVTCARLVGLADADGLVAPAPTAHTAG